MLHQSFFNLKFNKCLGTVESIQLHIYDYYYTSHRALPFITLKKY